MHTLADEIITIESKPKVSRDMKHFTVKGSFESKTPTWAGYREQVKIEGEYDLATYQHLKAGGTIKVSGLYTPPFFKDSRGLLLATSITPASAPGRTMDDELMAFNHMPAFNQYLAWRDTDLVAWMHMDKVIDDFLCKYPEHFKLDAESEAGQPWVELSKGLREANTAVPISPAKIWIAPQELVDAAVGETVRKALFQFAESIGIEIVKTRPRPKLESVGIDI
jgi:hypothetical protein